MDLIKLLDVSNPKKIKDTINLLIENYEGFGDDIRAIADKAAEDSAAALLAGNEAKQIAQNSATTLLQSVTQQNNIISQNFEEQDEIIAQNTTTSDQAKQIAEEALAMIEQADARSQAATETAEDALDLANESIETSELAMNVATEAKSTVDQAISTGVFGTFVHNTAGVSLLHAYMTDNLEQENTDDYFYMATPKLVRDALTNYYTKDEAAAKTDIPTEYLVKAVDGFYTLDSYADHTGIYMERQDGAKKGIYFKDADFACITSGPYPNSYRIFSLRNVVRTTDTDQEIAGIKNYTGGLQKNSVDVATVNDIPTTLSELTEDTTHRLVTDTEKSTWNNKSDFSGSYNDLTDKPTIPTTLAELSEDSTHRLVTDNEKETWNAKSDFSGNYNDLTNKPTIPTINVNGTPQSTINFDSDPQTQIDNIANNTTLIQNSSGGFSAGYNASNTTGGAAIGYNAYARTGGAAIGGNTTANGGAAVGPNATAGYGGAVGMSATASYGGAVGDNTKTGKGFAGGKSARTVNSNDDGIDAIQLGTGTNSQEKTLQIYDDNIYDANTHNLSLLGSFSALNNIGGGFSISDPVNVGIELGRRDGTSGTPYLDFHTDGNPNTDFNVRMLASGSELQITAADGISINGVPIIESGSNTNGYYTKLADGTLICRYSFTDKLSSGHTVTFPHPFISTEDLSITTQQARESGISAQWINGQAINKISKTGFNVYAGYSESSTIYWKAIGRWK